jgi:fumarate reductase subunit D
MTAGHDQGPDRTEPFWWGLFAAGGGMTALFAPAHILFQHLLGLGRISAATSSYERTCALTENPLVRLYLFALTSLSLFHWAHRFRYYVMDFGILGARRFIAGLCYGSAVIGTLGAARTLLRLPDRET